MTRMQMMASLMVVQGWILASMQSATTAPQSVYTQAQSTRGETTYGTACASCHGADLAGDGQAPSLAGKDFDLQWNDQPLSDLFDRIRATMPADNPGGLKPAEVAEIIAFILNKSRLPAGQTELPADMTALKQMKYVAPKP